MADYSQYQGPSAEWVEFTKTTVVPATGPAPGQSIEDYQKAANAGREKASALSMEKLGLRTKVSQKDFQVPTRDGQSVRARLYRPADVPSEERLPLYIFFHGGGYFFGTLDSEDARCCRIALACRITVLNVCYRHTPHFKYPTQHHDAWDSFEWANQHLADLGAQEGQLIVGGISSGGSLAAATMLREYQSSVECRLRGQVLCIPSLCPTELFPFDQLASKEISSFHQNADAPILPRAQRDLFFNMFAAKEYSELPYSMYAMQKMDLSKLPKSAFLVAGMDALRDEALLYAEQLQACGVPTDVHIFPGVPHGFHRYEELSATRRWDEVVNKSIKWILSDVKEAPSANGRRRTFKVES
ncbi:hypothetical protein N7510_002642 [Penicillium lagena]|uniref:uncharacterized protein n=1 Tax=Penicillium lagena TaxID=94218 RepID=UPI0025415999|nr:uncharacterized protein N7510_002642 [Penicillium lagena]KAJ5626333.1 hypothetical protein N7510_002642 [Penicillium lagena]